MEWEQLRERITNAKCLVFGDILLDIYLYGSVERISPEAPIPVVHVKEKSAMLGGAGNVAANVRRYGAQTFLCGMLGEDESAERVAGLMEASGIVFTGVRDKGHTTTTKTRVIGKNQQIVRVDDEIIFSPAGKVLESQWFKDNLGDLSVVVISDYNKGFCTPEQCRGLIDASRKNGVPVIVDPKCRDWSKYIGADLIKPNFSEFCEVVGKTYVPDDEIVREARLLCERYDIGNVLITMSERGMILVNPQSHYRLLTKALEVADVSGAGDTVIATLATFIASGLPVSKAVEFANTAAGLVVERVGTSTVSLDELYDAADDNEDKYGTLDKIISAGELAMRLKMWRRRGKKIVFTNGCFDIVHPGHIGYLERARKLGDILIVGLNSDQSVKRLKGDTRPINDQAYRSMVLAALQAVNAVVVFDELTPERMIKDISPGILVKGGDYALEEVVGREYAGETVILPFIQDFSTTGVIDRCRKSDMN